MATFEVFVPVVGEIIFRVEANNIQDAAGIAATLDWSDGDLNVEQDDTSHEGTRIELIDGAEGDLDDETPGYDTVEEYTGRIYTMRHFNVASLV